MRSSGVGFYHRHRHPDLDRTQTGKAIETLIVTLESRAAIGSRCAAGRWRDQTVLTKAGNSEIWPCQVKTA